jgi:hypothetical protein
MNKMSSHLPFGALQSIQYRNLATGHYFLQNEPNRAVTRHTIFT